MKAKSFVVGTVLLMAGVHNLLFAQHGGHGSSGNTHSGPSSTVNSTLSNRSSSAGQMVYPTPLGIQHQYSGYTGINPGVLSNSNGNRQVYRGGANHDNRGNRGRNNGYGYSAFPYIPYYLSTFDDYDSPYVYNTQQDPAVQTANTTANLLGEQVANLSAEVDALRNERSAHPTYDYVPTRQPEDNSPAQPITLVLKTGKHVQIKSYAIMGRYIWDFSAQQSKRIAVSSIDLAASKAATEESGAEFPEIQ